MPSAHGEISRAVSAIDPRMLTMHMRIMGATGTGKSALMLNIAKHLEMANASGSFASASVMIDVKDDDSARLLRQLEPSTLASGKVVYIDLNSAHAPDGSAPVGINILEIGGYDKSDRDAAVSQAVGHVMDIMREVYSQKHVYVQVERLIRLLLMYLYSRSDSPTMLDLHEAALQIQGNREAGERMARSAPDALRGPLRAASRLRADQWVPVLNRTEPFAVDDYLRKRFSVPHTTVDFARALEPGSVTIFRIAEAETPAHAHAMAARVVALKVWQAVLARSAARAERTPVVLFLDEFHVLGEMDLLGTMASRGRSQGLGLVLAHQNSSQAPQGLLATLSGNSSTTVFGRVSGEDAHAAATILDPAGGRALAARLAALSNRSFAMMATPPPGQERAAPTWFDSRPPPPARIGEAEAAAIEAAMCRAHAPEAAPAAPEGAWRAHLGARYLPAAKWRIVLSLMGGKALNGASVSGEVVNAGLAINRDEVNAWIGELAEAGTLEVSHTRKRGSVTERFYRLSGAGVREYESPDWSAIGTAHDVAGVAAAAHAHYVAEGKFVCIAAQGGGTESPDLVTYDHSARIARAVEIESRSEVISHPEHVIHNMAKAGPMGFSGCDTWSLRPHIRTLRGRLDGPVARTVKCYVMEGGSWVCA